MGTPVRDTDGTPTVPARRALVAAIVAVAIANAWVGIRLPALLQDTRVHEILDVERRAAAFPRERVRVLVAGNSHALAGLRPPVLAAALGLGPDAVFSFALPAGSAQESRLMLERHLASFPRVALVLCTVDEFQLAGFQEMHLRYLTAGNGVERARFAAGQPLETQLRLLAGTWLPLLDFGATLHADLAAHPAHTLRLLVHDGPPTNPFIRRAMRRTYRWGFPPPWDAYTARQLRLQAIRHRSPDAVAQRAAFMLADRARVPIGVAEVGRLTGWLAARGVPLVLVEVPYTALLDAALRRLDPDAQHAWRAALAALPAAERPPRIQAPELPSQAFYDADHLAPAGAQALARHVAQAPVVRALASRLE